MHEDWARLCELLDDDPELLPTVLDAADDDGDPWAALIDGLDDSGALAYLDADDTGVELADALAQLPRVFRSGLELDEVGDVTGGIEAAIASADSILAACGLRIVFLEEEADSYPLVVVPRGHVAEILGIASRFGRDARTFD